MNNNNEKSINKSGHFSRHDAVVAVENKQQSCQI